MESVYFNYMLKASLSMGVLSILYFCFLRHDTLNGLRRISLIFILLFSAIFPFIRFNLVAKDSDSLIYQVNLSQIEINPINPNLEKGQAFNYQLIILTILIIGAIFFSLKFLVQLFSVLILIRKSKLKREGSFIFIYVEENITPFSFFNLIFISTDGKAETGSELMIKHEKAHARQKHSFDVMLAELFCIVFWWNPIVWLLRREIKVNLEYLADKDVLSDGIDATKYQYLLLKTAQNNASIYIINDFNISQLKKRITMINKQETSKFLSIKYVLILPIVVFLIATNLMADNMSMEAIVANNITSDKSVPKEGESDKDSVYRSVDVMPRFQGGEAALMKFIRDNLKYPESAAKNKIEGRVVIRFTISELGKVSDIRVLRSLDAECDAAAIAVVEAMPDWIPGKQDGKDVSVYYTLPVQYKLQKDTPKE